MTKKQAETYWTPRPRPHFDAAQKAGIVTRNVLPLVGVLFFGWSASQFVLITVFNLGLAIVCMGCIASAVAWQKSDRQHVAWPGSLTHWISLIATALMATVLFTAMFGWVIGLFVHWDASFIWAPVLAIFFALPAIVQQYKMDLASPMTESERKKRDQPNVITLVLCAGLIFMMSGYIADFGRFWLTIVAIAITVLLTFKDFRPDLMRELTRPKNMPPDEQYGEPGKKHDLLKYILRGKKPTENEHPPERDESGNPHS
jgi:hypothetical protein